MYIFFYLYFFFIMIRNYSFDCRYLKWLLVYNRGLVNHKWFNSFATRITNRLRYNLMNNVHHEISRPVQIKIIYVLIYNIWTQGKTAMNNWQTMKTFYIIWVCLTANSFSTIWFRSFVLFLFLNMWTKECECGKWNVQKKRPKFILKIKSKWNSWGNSIALGRRRQAINFGFG